MRVLAYVAQSLARPWRWIRRWPGTRVLTCPPMTGETVTAGDLEGYDVLVFKLHGLPGQPYWYGDNWQTALTAETVREANLDGVMVFAANCHAITPRGKAGEMVQALLDAGARAVVAGAGQNLASNWGMVGADLLGRWWVGGVGMGLGMERAFELAKMRLRVELGVVRDGKRRQAAEDALKFRVCKNDSANEQGKGV